MAESLKWSNTPVMCVGSTGIAATLMKDRTTAHLAFGLAVNNDPLAVIKCGLPEKGEMNQFVEKDLQFIFWDEVTVQNRRDN
ncbi:unnamed protein product [Ambrosiozyma monospora]|uniref:Unnamed protein product n=1 Tax=Ambrosiozyma monospora TaxID=43982 RepID=A0ACB5TNA8_AMBMO|nr:unnamed protein product [Ambrosiozyma monospora]